MKIFTKFEVDTTFRMAEL